MSLAMRRARLCVRPAQQGRADLHFEGSLFPSQIRAPLWLPARPSRKAAPPGGESLLPGASGPLGLVFADGRPMAARSLARDPCSWASYELGGSPDLTHRFTIRADRVILQARRTPGASGTLSVRWSLQDTFSARRTLLITSGLPHRIAFLTTPPRYQGTKEAAGEATRAKEVHK